MGSSWNVCGWRFKHYQKPTMSSLFSSSLPGALRTRIYPPDQLWLTSYAEAGSDIKISGIALNEDLIAAFLRNIEASSDYMNVELLVSEQKEIEGAKIKRFDISCKLHTASDTDQNQKTKEPK